MKHQQGFTLIEILIAMAIFTLIGLASTSLLTTVIDSNELSSERFAKLQTLQRAMLTLERDIEQALPRQVRINGETTSVVLRGGEVDDSDADGIAFVRGGWHNPKLMLPRSTLQGVAYRLQNGEFQRLHHIYVDNVIGTEPKVRTLLTHITDLQIEFFTLSDNDNDLNWKDSYTGTVLPAGIAVTIDSEEFGQIRRVFALSGGAS